MSGGVIRENGSVKDPTASDPHVDTNHHCCEVSSAPHSQTILPTYKPSCSSTPIYYSSPQISYSDVDQDSHSLTSQDSGIPTLEINPPEPILHSHQRPGDSGLILDSHDSPATLPLTDDPSGSNTIRKSSTFPRSGYDSIRLFSPNLRLSTTSMGVGGGVLNRSDDISVCSASSMSTELSVSNEDILDFTVTSDSSAIVTLETDLSGTAHFSDVTLSSPSDLRSPIRQGSGVMKQEDDGRQKKLGPLSSLFNRSVHICFRIFEFNQRAFSEHTFSNNYTKKTKLTKEKKSHSNH